MKIKTEISQRFYHAEETYEPGTSVTIYGIFLSEKSRTRVCFWTEYAMFAYVDAGLILQKDGEDFHGLKLIRKLEKLVNEGKEDEAMKALSIHCATKKFGL